MSNPSEELLAELNKTLKSKKISSKLLETVKELLSKGADPNYVSASNISPIDYAILPDVSLLKILLEAGANPDGTSNSASTPLDTAAYQGDIEPVIVLINAGANVNGNNNTTPLMFAVKNQKYIKSKENGIKIMRALIAAGADINAQNEQGRTAIMSAAQQKRFEYLLELYRAGANMNIVDKDGKTVYNYLSKGDRVRFEEYIRKKEQHSARLAAAMGLTEANTGSLLSQLPEAVAKNIFNFATGPYTGTRDPFYTVPSSMRNVYGRRTHKKSSSPKGSASNKPADEGHKKSSSPKGSASNKPADESHKKHASGSQGGGRRRTCRR
jgi:ankyrin repeat protein